MKRVLTCTGVGLMLGLASTLAQTEPPATQPMQTSPQQPSPDQPTEITPPQPEAQPPTTPEAANPSPNVHFLQDQKSSDWLATELIGVPVVNASNETIGDINDLVTYQGGKILGVVIGAGGFLGLGEKDVAVRFEDLKIAREGDKGLNVVANLTKDQLASAPDFETLDEQAKETDRAGDR